MASGLFSISDFPDRVQVLDSVYVDYRGPICPIANIERAYEFQELSSYPVKRVQAHWVLVALEARVRQVNMLNLNPLNEWYWLLGRWGWKWRNYHNGHIWEYFGLWDKGPLFQADYHVFMTQVLSESYKEKESDG